MCGIAGMISLRQGRNADWESTDRMLARIKHRGPDDSGVCAIMSDGRLLPARSAADLKKSCGGGQTKGVLGFNRLSIQDISEAGHQPMISGDGRVVLTFNGEIYNVNLLRKQIKEKNPGIQFAGTSDTEVILCLYQMFGFSQMLEMLNGMFAIVLYDCREEKLYIARDRFGIIPLHLWVRDDELVWASEIKCFLELQDFKRSIDLVSFSRSFLYCYPNDSLFHEIISVEPGTYMEINVASDAIKPQKTRFYDINCMRQTMADDGDYIVESCRKLLSDCVNRQLISDVPVGVQFSGGIDSTLLAKYVSDIFAENGYGMPYSFSLVNKEYREYSEEKWIDHAASHIAIRNNKFDMDQSSFLQNFERSIYAYERMINIPSPIGIYEFSKHARRDVTVLISGEGADEVCGGYGTFSVWKAMEWLKAPHMERLSSKFDGKLVGAEDNFLFNFDRQSAPELCRKLFPDYDCGNVLEERREYWRQLGGTNFDKARKLYFHYELISLLERQNKICMAHSVENRVPFLDNEVVEFMFSVPEHYLLHRSTFNTIKKRKIHLGAVYEGKYLLKRLSAAIYGKEFAYRTKQAIRLPLADYMRDGRFREYLEGTIIPGMKKRGYIDMNCFYSLYQKMEAPENALLIWKAVNFEAWNQLFVDGRMPVSG